MPDLYDPIQTQVTPPAAVEILSDFITDLLARTHLYAILYSNNVALTPQITLQQLTEATFGGYARQTVSSFNGPYIDPNHAAYAQSPLLTFACNGTASNTIYGSALVGTPPGATPATATNAGAAGGYSGSFTITGGGSGYQFPPAVKLTGAGGSGAAAHSVITGGVVTDIILDSPGTGYSTYPVVIDPPLQLIQINQLSTSGISMALSTDALPTYVQLTQPATNVANP